MIPRLSRTSAVISCLSMFERREKVLGGKPNWGSEWVEMYRFHARRASRPHRENVVGGGTNEYGEPVLLLLPSDDCREGRNRKKNNSVASVASSSHAGGLPRYHDGDKLAPCNVIISGRHNDISYNDDRRRII
jgi:hypothetical protein